LRWGWRDRGRGWDSSLASWRWAGWIFLVPSEHIVDGYGQPKYRRRPWQGRDLRWPHMRPVVLLRLDKKIWIFQLFSLVQGVCIVAPFHLLEIAYAMVDRETWKFWAGVCAWASRYLGFSDKGRCHCHRRTTHVGLPPSRSQSIGRRGTKPERHPSQDMSYQWAGTALEGSMCAGPAVPMTVLYDFLHFAPINDNVYDIVYDDLPSSILARLWVRVGWL
jgi:hypothetical protein